MSYALGTPPFDVKECQQRGLTFASPLRARVRMPRAYAAQMGGVCTLIGTSSNLLTDTLAQKHGLAPIGVFEFTKLGAILALAGITYLLLVGRWLLPQKVDAQFPVEHDIGKYVAELRVGRDSTVLDKTIEDIGMGEKYGVHALELLRGEEQMWPPRSEKLQPGDVLLVRGEWDKIEDFRKTARLEHAPEHRYTQEGDDARVLVEIMVAPASRAIGRNLPDLNLQWLYDANVLAIHRRGHILRSTLKSVDLDLGDVLLMLVDEDKVARLRSDDRFIVLSAREEAPSTPRKAWYAVGIMVSVVVASGMHWLPIPAAAICGAVAMAFAGCYGRRDIYQSMDWKIIVLLGAILPLGIAIEKTGLADAVVSASMGLVGDHGPLLALLVVYLLTALLTELMGHNPSVVLMVGIAVSMAHSVHADPRPFVVAVAFAAATSFATPVGYPTNTMVYYAGGYRFTDFMKVGIPLIALFCVLSMWLIPQFWPFHP